MDKPLNKIFMKASVEKRALFMPYICVGYPTFDLSVLSAKAALDAGADVLELGVPFSDPIADGPTLQKATHASLVGGTKFKDVFKLIRILRSQGARQPLLVMSYLNPIEQMGWVTFAKTLKEAGGDGVIVPDLPLEQMGEPGACLSMRNLAITPFLTPTSGPERIKKVDSLKAPFLYYVSVTGVTGARRDLPSDLLTRLKLLRRTMKTPVVVGFGISTAEQARRVGRVATGVIIASALVDLIGKTPRARIKKAVGRFCEGVVRALKN